MRLARLNGALTGILGMLCVVRCQLPVRGQEAPAGGLDPHGVCSYPPDVDSIKHLGVHYLNSGAPIPWAFNMHSADLDESGSARFRIYALTDDPRFCADVTGDFADPLPRGSLGKLRVQLHPATPLSALRHRFRLVGEGRNTYAEYTPEIRWGPRTDHLRFFLSIRHQRSRILGDFALTVPGVVNRLGSP